MVRRLVVVLLLAVSFQGFCDDPKDKDASSDEKPKPHSPPAKPREATDGDTSKLKTDQVDFLETHFPISKTFAEGYRLNIFGRGDDVNKDDHLAGQEVAELLLSGEDADENAWKERLQKIADDADAKIKAILNDRKEEGLSEAEKNALRFYKKLKWGIAYETKDKSFPETASKQFQIGYLDGRKDKEKAGQAYQAAKKELAGEPLTESRRTEILTNLDKDNRLNRAALLGYAGAKYWKGKSSFTAPGDALRMAAVPDKEGRLFVTLTDPDSKKATAYFVGNRRSNVDGASTALAQQMADWSDENKSRAWDTTPLDKVEKFASYKSGDKGLELEQKKQSEFAKLAFSPPTIAEPAISFASKPSRTQFPGLVAALKKKQGACFTCHGVKDNAAEKIGLNFSGTTPQDFKVNGKTLTELADLLPQMGKGGPTQQKLADAVRAWATAQ